MITIKELQDISQGKAEPTDETILPYMLWARQPLSTGVYNKYVNECKDDNILAALFLYQINRTEGYLTRINARQMNKWTTDTLKNAFPNPVIEAGEKVGYDATKLGLLKIMVGVEKDNTFDRVLGKLASNITLNKKDIDDLSKEDIDKIFDNYKDIKYKVRLYSLTASKNFDEKHINKAMKNLGFSSFCIDDGEECPVPFKLSYINDMTVSDPRFYNLIEYVTRSKLANLLKDSPGVTPNGMHKNYYGNTYSIGRAHIGSDGSISNSYSGTKSYIKLDVDMTESQITTQFFPLLLKNEEVYKKIMRNLGVFCSYCEGTGNVTRQCAVCQGRGYVNSSYGYGGGVNCKTCNGRGMINDKCVCGGKK